MKDKNVYINTYFRVNSGYIWGIGLSTEAIEEFNAEVIELLESIGFIIIEPKSSNSCYRGIRGAESLYCHPQSLSGYVKRESIRQIEDVLNRAKSFQLTFIDTYDEAMNFTKEEFQQELENKRLEIEQMILETFITKRKNLFKSKAGLDYIKSGIKYFSSCKLEEMERAFIEQVFQSLVKQGKIQGAQTKMGECYRTVKKASEKKKQKEECMNTQYDLFSETVFYEVP